jgi:hypothetical protein
MSPTINAVCYHARDLCWMIRGAKVCNLRSYEVAVIGSLEYRDLKIDGRRDAIHVSQVQRVNVETY